MRRLLLEENKTSESIIDLLATAIVGRHDDGVLRLYNVNLGNCGDALNGIGQLRNAALLLIGSSSYLARLSQLNAVWELNAHSPMLFRKNGASIFCRRSPGE